MRLAVRRTIALPFLPQVCPGPCHSLGSAPGGPALPYRCPALLLPFPTLRLPFAYRAVLATYPAIASARPSLKGKKASNIKAGQGLPCHRAYPNRVGPYTVGQKTQQYHIVAND